MSETPTPYVCNEPQKPRIPPQLAPFLFNTENAREMQRKGVEARRITVEPEPEPTCDNSYLAGRLARVRTQIAKIDELYDKAKDPLDLDRLARAMSTLAELERVLDNRPLPGSRRPGKERSTGSQDVAPI